MYSLHKGSEDHSLMNKTSSGLHCRRDDFCSRDGTSSQVTIILHHYSWNGQDDHKSLQQHSRNLYVWFTSGLKVIFSVSRLLPCPDFIPDLFSRTSAPMFLPTSHGSKLFPHSRSSFMVLLALPRFLIIQLLTAEQLIVHAFHFY